MNISRSQAQALADGFLNDIGTSRGNITNAEELPVVIRMLSEGANVFITNASENLKNANAISTGELVTSLEFTVEQDGKIYQLSCGYPASSKAANYFDYVNKGVAGTDSDKGSTGQYKFKTPYPSKKMAAAILNWIRKNGLKATTRDAKKYTLAGIETKGTSLRKMSDSSASLKSLAYAVSSSIKKKGLKATKYFDDAIATSFGNEFLDALGIALATDVRIQIRKHYKDNH